jgi:hypothetical protein
MQAPHPSPLYQLPPPTLIHQYIGRLYRELTLLRRLLRLSQAVQEQRAIARSAREGGALAD